MVPAVRIDFYDADELKVKKDKQMLLIHFWFHVISFLFISLDWCLVGELLAKIFSLAKTNSNPHDHNASNTSLEDTKWLKSVQFLC